MPKESMTSLRLPIILISLALVMAVFYRTPKSGGVQAPAPQPSSEEIFSNPEVVRSLSKSDPSDMSLEKPTVTAPARFEVADSSVQPPAVRKSLPPDFAAGAKVDVNRGPEVPELTGERVYLPDSVPTAVPSVPTLPEKPLHPMKIAVIHQGNGSINQVALTFDDGPNNKYTPQILDILKEYNIKATFFVLGEEVKRFPEVLKRIAAEGHEIGNHTYTHPLLTKLDDEKLRQELASTQEEIHKVLGYSPKLMRPPYGAYRNASLPVFEDLGLNIVLWSVDTYDWKKGGESIIRTVSKESKNGSIILCHDRKAQTVKVLPAVINDLLSRGLKPVTVSELTGLPDYDFGTPRAELQPEHGRPGT